MKNQILTFLCRSALCGVLCFALLLTLLVTGKANADSAVALKDLYANDFRMGVACEAISHWRNALSEIGNPDKEALILEQFNSITFGNELKPEYNMNYKGKGATETNLPFGHNRAAIEMLDWAKANGIAVRGHTLIWHSQCPDAVFCKKYTRKYGLDGKLDPACLVDAETLKLRMESYIHNVMEYMYANGYGDVIYAWDVVNEAIEPGMNADNMRQSYWYQIIGPEFLYDAFRYAREAVEQYSAEYASLYGIDPNDADALKAIQPKLFYNDYNEFQVSKCEAIIRAVEPIVADGYLDGIGMQGHLAVSTNIPSYIKALKRYAEVVDEVQITELDVTQSSNSVQSQRRQGDFYRLLFTELLKAKEEGVNLTAVTIWGLTDDNSWKKESYPLIFNGDLSPKDAYNGIVRAKTGEEMAEPEWEAPDLSDGVFDFENRTADLGKLGFVKRGDGELSIQKAVTHFGKGALMNTGRTASWNGTSFDVSRFAGQTISVSAYVKSDDSTTKLTADIDGVWPNIASAKTGAATWSKIEGTYTIPADMTSLSLYFETNGTADLYIDDVTIKLVGMDEGFEADTHRALGRGVGHMPSLSVQNAERHSGQKSLHVTREAQEASVQFDISKYVGRIVEASVYVKTADETITLGLEGEKGAFVTVPAADGWTEVRGTFAVPASRTSAQLYVETSGTADFWVDDLSVRIGSVSYDMTDGVMPFSTRWQGAGTLKLVEDEGRNVACLTDQDQTYYGICYDVTPFLGMEVEISFDVKTDDRTVRVTGDIDGVWPGYLSASVNPGSYTTVSGKVRFPSDLPGLRIYIETSGNADIYVGNFSIQRV